MSRPIRLGLLAASPVYYQTPLYQRLAADSRLDFTALFASSAGVRPIDGGFGRDVQWDVNPLAGYRSEFLRKADRNSIEGTTTLAFRDWDAAARVRHGTYDALWLHGYNSVTHAIAAVAQRTRGGGLLIREEQTLLHRRSVGRRLVKSALLRILFRHASGLYIGGLNREWFAHYGMPAERLFFTPYCVDNEAFRRQAAELSSRREELREEFGIGPNGGPVILATMRLVPKKQPLFLLEAFRKVRARQRCSLLIVGSGPLEDQLRAEAARDESASVHFAGFLNRSEISRAYAAADVFALASLEHETWGVVVNEAMNFRLPLVLSDKVGSARDLLEEGTNGFVADAADPHAFADRLERLVVDSDLRKRFGAASLARVEAWNYDAAAQGVLNGLRSVVGEARWSDAEDTVKP